MNVVLKKKKRAKNQNGNWFDQEQWFSCEYSWVNLKSFAISRLMRVKSLEYYYKQIFDSSCGS